MNNIISTKQTSILLLFAFFVVLTASLCYAQEESIRVAVTPFTLNAPEDMAYLKSGIQDMLESRLSQDKNITVVSDEKTAQAMVGLQEPIDENEAREIGHRLDADFVLIGSLTVFGSSASLDARLVDSAGEKETTAFFEQSESIDDLVPKINSIAADVNAKIAGTATASVAAVTPLTGGADSQTQAHPEKMAKEEIETGADDSGEEVKVSAAVGLLSETAWKSRTYKFNIHGMALGDVDGDGKTETVVITNNTLAVFRSENNQFFKIKEIKESSKRHFVGVDVADTNGNGFAEIFVSGLTPKRTGVFSSIYEYNRDGVLEKVVNKSLWLYRVVDSGDNKEKLLLGQEFKPKSDGTAPIFAMAWKNGEYHPENQVIASKPFVALGVAYGRLTPTGPKHVVAYNYDERIQIVDEFGEALYDSQERYGGTTLFYSKGRIGKGETDKTFLTMRLLLSDLDNDGQNEVVVTKNFDATKRVFDNSRVFTAGQIETFAWDGLGLSSRWTSQKMSGRGIRDLAVGDFDNDGKKELVAVVLIKEGAVIGMSGKSRLVAYQLESLTETE